MGIPVYPFFFNQSLVVLLLNYAPDLTRIFPMRSYGNETYVPYGICALCLGSLFARMRPAI